MCWRPIGLPRSRVARRVLAVFLLAAVLPIAAISAGALAHVSRQLEREAGDRLKQACKSAGMTLIGRLRDSAEALDEAAHALQTDGEGGARSAEAWTRVGRYFSAVTRIGADGEATALIGPVLEAPALRSASTTDAIARLYVERFPGSRKKTLLSLPVDRDRPELGRLVGELDPMAVRAWIENGPLPAGGSFCVLNSTGSVIVCSEHVSAGHGARLREQSRASTSGLFTWTVADEELMAAYWSVFLEPLFGAGTWTVILAEPRASILAPVARFRALFPAIVIVCVGFASLLSIAQLRKLLTPLDSLRQGTRRIGAGDFDLRIDLESGDEFEDLAESFNTMTARISTQFANLEKMVEIDRSILSRTEASEITRCVLAGVRDLYPCDFVALVATEGLIDETTHAVVSREASGEPERVDLPPLAHVGQTLAGLAGSWIPLDESSPPALEFLREEGIGACTCLPIRIDDEIVCALVLGHRDPGARAEERLVYARQLADQMGVALQNARTLEANRVLAYYDNLTGMPNRLLFKERLDQALREASRRSERLAVCLLDLDGFKRINDTLGHESGDELLKAVAHRLSVVVRDGSLARLGGDEFTIMLTSFDRTDTPAIVMRKVLAELARPFQLNAQHVVITASIGIAVYPEDGTEIDTLLKNADSAMYHAKDEGRNNYQFYTAGMNASALDRLRLEGDLRAALEQDELRVYYQPVFEVDSLDIVGAEALIRWQSPERGLVPPAEFISVAEETGLILPMGDWILRTAARDVARWQAEGLGRLRVSVNLSGRQLKQPGLLSGIAAALEETGLPPSQLTLELTETMLMDAGQSSIAFFVDLRTLGIHLAVDDFGTGYSSLAYLKHFPLDYLKIDRSFVMDVTRNADDAAITRAIVAMAHSLSLRVVAEGVETEEQLGFLRDLGCELGQGHLFSPPVPAADFEKLLRERSGSA